MPFKKGHKTWNKGKQMKPVSIETREKLRNIHKGKPKSPEHCRKISEARKKKEYFVAEKNPAWKGGVSMAYRRKTAPRPMPLKCEVCGDVCQMCYDHNHKTNEFRGWLCSRCNVALGMAKDDIKILKKLILYLKKYD